MLCNKNNKSVFEEDMKHSNSILVCIVLLNVCGKLDRKHSHKKRLSFYDSVENQFPSLEIFCFFIFDILEVAKFE